MDVETLALWSWDGGATLVAPFVAIALALVTKRVVPSLAAAVVVGALVAARGDPIAAAPLLARVVRGVVLDVDNLTVSLFCTIVAAAVGVMAASGGIRAMVALVEPLARGGRGAQTAGWLAGLVVFFDDYTNCLVVGNGLAPLCDRYGVSRAKLAYIADSTAAPVASLAVVSTWIGFELGVLDDALDSAGAVTLQALPLFVAALPYRFYCLLTIVFGFVIAFSGRDFGPMWAEEAAAQPRRAAREAGSAPPRSAWLAAAPVAALVGVTVGAMVVSGRAALSGETAATPLAVFGAADAIQSLLAGSIAAWTIAAGLALAAGALRPRAVWDASWASGRAVGGALVVLYLAWSLGDLIQQSSAAEFLAHVLTGRLPVALLPAAVFVLACVTSFATGTSWFTMAALVPLVVPLAIAMGGDAMVPVVLASTAAVIDGAIFGDHASPISDTTILSAIGSGCDVLLHVRTQLPYALVIAAITLVLGTVPVGLGAPWFVVLPTAATTCVVWVLLFGRSVQAVDDVNSIR